MPMTSCIFVYFLYICIFSVYLYISCIFVYFLYICIFPVYLYISCFLSTDLCGEPAGEWVPMTSCCLGFTLFSLVLLGAQTGGQGAHLLFWNETIFIQDVADKFFEQHVDQTSAKSPTNLTYFVRC